ncbi:TAT-variant-translocated molybdopterin oxidoreductase [Halpernia sp.]|uniref:TAT-variant-translocated molybdopterin oxidoreductase n=1 Tax=Halpernia sp. TaxID=2782209 RepID=UPI003A90A5D1
MASNKIQFRSIHELKDQTLNAKLAAKEFQNEIPVDEFLGDAEKMNQSGTSRRDFLKLLGFSTAAVTLAACEAPVIKSIPYVVKPHNIIPGVPNYFASTYFNGSDFASVLVKTREGRPIKIEPNAIAGDLGKTSARAQASVLSLYDNDKIKQPKLDGKDDTFDSVDNYVLKGLNQATGGGKKIVVLSHSFPSPTFKKLFGDFKAKYPTAELVIYDALPNAAALDASEEVFGQRTLPVYDLSNTELVVSFNADFLEEYLAANLQSTYSKARKPGPNMLRHIQVESNLSLTGANSDTRIKLKPSDVYKTLVEVYNGLNGGTSNKQAAEIVKELQSKGSKAVVFADGSKAAVVLSYLINQKLGSVAFTGKANMLKEFDGARYQEFLSWLNNGQVGILITNNVNPIYSSSKSQSDAFKAAVAKAPFVISFSEKKDEMYQLATAVIPVAHWLESWGDIMPRTGAYSLMQPTIQKVYKPRQLEESLLVWINGKNSPLNNYYDYLKANATTLLGSVSFNKGLYGGFNEVEGGTGLSYSGGNAAQAIVELSNFKSSKLELVLYTKASIGDGAQGNNPWLQELPDGISRLSWDNYLTISPKDAKDLGLENELNGRMQLDGSVVDLTANGVKLENVPVFIQPGQADGSVGLALGYGKKFCGKAAETGINAYPLFDGSNLAISNVSISKKNDSYEFAGMQLQNTLMGRYEIAKEIPLETFLNVKFDDTTKDSEGSIKGWNVPLEYHTINGALPAGKIDLWDAFDDTDGPHFNLSVDLNACTGCGACVVACQAENNIPVVGKDEIRMSRDMYWIRIDRYYTAKEKIETKEAVDRGLDVPNLYDILIQPNDSPDVIFQPVMCQHCNHAPCETVCPVAATSHGKQGQNMMAYNRCIGTRYCANNCPYKVRRFNWFTYNLNDKFDYNMNNDLGRMVLNPDVVVRTRGVMEKCSMCIQQTQNVILEAKKANRIVADGEFHTACESACPTGAFTFGDMNDKSSKVRSLFNDDRKYILLEEIGTKPNVFYHTKIRNRKENNV